MIIDLSLSKQIDWGKLSHKIVIIGAGPVGIYLAYRLKRAGQPVVLIEAGGRVVDSSRNTLATESIGHKFVGHEYGRTFGLGGTSVVWGGQLAEFDRRDFDTWPIGFEEVQSLYAKVYADVGIVPRSNAVYRKRLGGEEADDLPVERFFTHWLPQQNFARIFKQEVVEDPTIPVLLNAAVSGVEFDGDRAKSVTLHAPDGREIKLPGRHFVFCQGTLEIIRFFLSTARRGQVPWQDNREIGKKFQDHPCGKAATAHITDEKRFRDFFENAVIERAVKLSPKLRTNETTVGAEKGETGVCGFFSFRSDIQEHLGNVKWLIRAMRSGAQGTSITSLPRDILTLIKVFGPVSGRFIRDRRIMAFFDRSVDLMVQCEQRPSSDSQIRLNNQQHYVPGLFGIDIDWRIDTQETMATVAKFTARTDEYLRARGVAQLEIDDKVLASDAAFLSSMSDVYHHAGGMCMAAAPGDGVVDSGCRVWGTQNVFVGGAAVFPTSSHANTTLTALALAARLASNLASEQ